MNKQRMVFWVLNGGGWLLVAYLIYAQAISAIDYEFGVAMGTQETAQQITEVGVAFYYGFAFGDLVVYLPLLILGLIGYQRKASWGRILLAAALGITIYWPIVCLAAIVDARDAVGWNFEGERDFWIVLPLITAWAIWALWQVLIDSSESG